MFRLLIIVLSLSLLHGCDRTPRGTQESLTAIFRDRPEIQENEGEQGWVNAVSPRQFSFPQDHAAHEDYRIEWWYYTGNLESQDGRRFGYQLTFFRTGLQRNPTNPSKWTVRDLYTAHFALSDIDRKQHFCFQRNNRQGVGQAGAARDRFHVWNGDWQVLSSAGESPAKTHRLQAADTDVAIDLTLSVPGSAVLHGEGGLSQKGATPGNASHYYSYPRMQTTGTVRIGGSTYTIQGHSWMDHEFSTSFLESGQLGWDWFAIQLDNDVQLMLYRMRRTDGSTDPFSSGSLIEIEGNVTHLVVSDYEMTPLRTWKSPETGAIYPLSWRITVPSRGYELVVQPAFDRQEMTTNDTTGISYWEGAIEVAGTSADAKVTGRGYMELTGYVGQGLGTLFDN